ncbi:MAG TPA: hypothetical protein VGN11_06100 [Candidatus Baltobacteraceae bacterium]|jgi:hypothetical protein|nr:hypothetical protein [Candidatus Baltobacteraceae bacterium]
MMRLLATAVAAAALAGIPAYAQSPTNDVRSVIAKMTERNPALNTFRAPLHVNVRMLNFPFLSPQLDGTSYFKRPNSYEVVFTKVPSYAKGFEKLFNDVGDPSAWVKDQNITFDGVQQLNGRPMLVLTMTKKIHSTILDRTVAYIDPASYELWEMDWHYTSGGVISMRQWYRSEGGFTVLSQQHAEINIPHVHAVADSSYGTYQTNVAVDDAVFTKK